MTWQGPPTAPAAAFVVHATRRRNPGVAVASHVKSAGVEGLRSAIDVVPGIGPKRRRMLLRRFGSVKGVKDASTDELAAVPGMTRTLAQRIKEYL